jgi:hypothetical protein
VPDVLEPLYQFKPHVSWVTQEDGQGRTQMHFAGRRKFTIVGPATHPVSKEPTYEAQTWSGPTDGQRFWLEPGWYERISEWADLV